MFERIARWCVPDAALHFAPIQPFTAADLDATLRLEYAAIMSDALFAPSPLEARVLSYRNFSWDPKRGNAWTAIAAGTLEVGDVVTIEARGRFEGQRRWRRVDPPRSRE